MRKILFIAALSLLIGYSSARAAEPLYYDKGYITKDTTWSGTVILRGQNVVKRGVTLTILPGTVVKFVWVDDDGDNIGDGELTCEGRLIAKGTKDNMIIFTSAKEKPVMKDWTFVQISVSKQSEVEYCKFEYAFSGLQVHYSTATVRNCIFTRNFEGMRFSTTDVLIEHNDFVDNFFGIRYEANGSRTTVTKNTFKDNEQTFFPVQKSGKTVKIFANNIVGSKNYSVKLGENQRDDMDYANNWWGTSVPEEIDESIFDKSKDGTLGMVTWKPFLDAPVKDCGMM